MKCAEKVLGFKKKDGSISVYHHARKGWIRYWVIDEPQMIPVVSLEWLEGYCNDERKIALKNAQGNFELSKELPFNLKKQIYLREETFNDGIAKALENLLLTAKKECGERTVFGEAEKIIEKNLSALKKMGKEAKNK